MFTYRNFLDEVIDTVCYREEIEWSNFWYDKANCAETSKRYLIIGDSTARMVRSTLARITNAPVDMLGTSSAIDDELFVKQIDSFFNKNYCYNVIFLQLGHHGRISHNGGNYTNNDFVKFRKDYLKLINYLKQYCKTIVIETVFDSVVSRPGLKYLLLKKLHIIKEKDDEVINACTMRKNEILETLEIYGNGDVKFLDINRLTKRKFYHIDHIHFEKKAKIYIAQEMIKIL